MLPLPFNRRTDVRLRDQKARAYFARVAKSLRAGDVLGFSACDCLGVGINLATWGLPGVGLSHVAICADHPDTGDLVLFESTSLYPVPCAIRGVVVSGLQCHAIRPRVATYRGKVWAYQLRKPLDVRQSNRLTAYCLRHLGTAYDAIGAFRSRQAGFGWLERRLRPEDLTSIFCSEFVAAAHRHVDVFQTANASAWNPNRYCRELQARGLVHEPERLH